MDDLAGEANGRAEGSHVARPEADVWKDDEGGRRPEPGGPRPALPPPPVHDPPERGDARRREEGRGEEIGRPLCREGKADGGATEREVSGGRAVRSEGTEEEERGGKEVPGDDLSLI